MNLLFSHNKTDSAPCLAHVSYSDEDSFGAVWDRERRGISCFGPRGIAYRPCEGDQLLLIPVEGSDSCVGVRSSTTGLLPGELRLTASGGASIHLKTDGSISLNGLVISPEGKLL